MKLNIFSEMDRLAEMSTKPPMTTIPVLDVQKQLDDDYRDQIEALNLKLLDQEDAAQFLKDRISRLELRIQDQNTRITSYQATLNENSFATARCTSLESDVKRLEADLKTETGNRDHFRSLVAQQEQPHLSKSGDGKSFGEVQKRVR
jgi:predicted  nucleic acid-binding Zn-ribbon protein